ncbi:low-density lipoprotein receptor-related protein 1 [Lingula anatina]|uniref:Low-density lipoprotein receptor-related protein 1 n=1 Tax=Lingula anatina TaxID=7574 RepID=A0A1S3JW45_LINAN|nr:low-density lipoprotein receptor-related protein 1 [Lingula anatina]|eukprot:XP_013414522.1 low-density lipoprotein receptor-related protein 1 [Lingula anatina]
MRFLDIGMLLAIGACYISSASLSDVQFAQDFLVKHGYLSSSKLATASEFREALQDFQKRMNIAISGEADDKTLEVMRMPRCSAPDRSPINGDDEFSFNLASGISERWYKWKLTWSIGPYTKDMSRKQQEQMVGRAYKAWSDISRLQISKAPQGSQGDLKVKFVTGNHGDLFPFDKSSFAHAFWPGLFPGTNFNGEVHMNDALKWRDAAKDPKTLLFKAGWDGYPVLLHEIGHALGIWHSEDPSAVMWPLTYHQGPLKPQADDIAAMQTIYGSPSAADVCKGPAVWPCDSYHEIRYGVVHRYCKAPAPLNEANNCGCERQCEILEENAGPLNRFCRCEQVLKTNDAVKERCTASIQKFACRNGKCIPRSNVCNKINNCGDRSDEADCVSTAPCGATQFRCSNGRCIPSALVCDGAYHCADKSDERVCRLHSGRCGMPGYTLCTDDTLRCIPNRWVCDGVPFCLDKSDERNCPSRSDGGWSNWFVVTACPDKPRCGDTIILRRRCNNPAPSPGKLPCLGATYREEPCLRSCGRTRAQLVAIWSSWAPYSCYKGVNGSEGCGQYGLEVATRSCRLRGKRVSEEQCGGGIGAKTSLGKCMKTCINYEKFKKRYPWLGGGCYLQCNNGGTCVFNDDDEPVCSCRSGFSGEQCMTRLTNECRKKCGNGGTCVMTLIDDYCECPDGYRGKLLEKKKG